MSELTLDELEKQLEGCTLEQQVNALKVVYLVAVSERKFLAEEVNKLEKLHFEFVRDCQHRFNPGRRQ